MKNTNGNGYNHFFYPEIEKFIGEETMKDIKKELLLIDQDIFNNFDKKRQEGENDSYICSLIREDSVIEFISYVNFQKISLSSKIERSIFETNSFLIENENTSLIEYSAFFGSIQIFQYLMMNQVELTPSLWFYAIHSNNATLFHILESNKVPVHAFTNEKLYKKYKSKRVSYMNHYIESIKCHHNELANYIKDYLLDPNEFLTKQKEYVIPMLIKYYNYGLFQIDSIYKYGLQYLSYYNYNELVDILFKEKENEIKEKTISN